MGICTAACARDQHEEHAWTCACAYIHMNRHAPTKYTIDTVGNKGQLGFKFSDSCDETDYNYILAV